MLVPPSSFFEVEEESPSSELDSGVGMGCLLMTERDRGGGLGGGIGFVLERDDAGRRVAIADDGEDEDDESGRAKVVCLACPNLDALRVVQQRVQSRVPFRMSWHCCLRC